jgi:D-alanyl-D-alanine carboxypeptidase/D-alanyl-D-alanine-endopeptidase (penicillin-binding protein 4)
MADLGSHAAYAVADTRGRILEGCNLDLPLVPASILKIATISAALDILGPEYRFRTDFFLDSERNLFIKGYGDPSLVSEEIAVIAQQLRQRGLHGVGQVVVDTSAFALEHQVPGQAHSDNPYDAPVGPLSVNFNAIALMKQGGRISSGEPQTPLLPLMTDLSRAYPDGRYRINICAKGCDAEERMARYAGELFVAQLQRQGISVAGYGGRRPVPERSKAVFTHHSRQNLREISHATLIYSSNFMANLVFLACGAKQYGYPATWAKARQAVHQQLVVQMGKEAEAIVQVEGAGLARENRVTAHAMLQLLQTFRPQLGLLKQEQDVSMKTGTLTGVYTLAGFLPGGETFVILLNQPSNSRTEVLNLIKKRFAATRPAIGGNSAP